MYTNQLKICNGVHFLDKIAGWGSAAFPKNAPPQVFFIFFAQICSFLERVSQIFTIFCFPENLLVATLAASNYGMRKPRYTTRQL